MPLPIDPVPPQFPVLGINAFNMALDEALLEAMHGLASQCCASMDGHERAASFGYFQNIGSRSGHLLRPLVRRPTAGG